jgi:hypothetical protein
MTRLLPVARGRQCPFCLECCWSHRDRYPWYEAFTSVLCLRPFRCLSCWSRFYVFGWKMNFNLSSEKEGRYTMFLAGLKFALGVAVGMPLLLCVAAFALIGVARFDCWLERRWRLQWEVKTRALPNATPRFRERAVFCFRFHTDDWIATSDKSEYLR